MLFYLDVDLKLQNFIKNHLRLFSQNYRTFNMLMITSAYLLVCYNEYPLFALCIFYVSIQENTYNMIIIKSTNISA